MGELGYDLGEPEVSKVQPNDISYPVMKKAIQDSHEKFIQWQISECQMTAQLDSYSLNDNNGSELRQHMDVLMHLIFLGAVETTLKAVGSFVKLH